MRRPDCHKQRAQADRRMADGNGTLNQVRYTSGHSNRKLGSQGRYVDLSCDPATCPTRRRPTSQQRLFVFAIGRLLCSTVRLDAVSPDVLPDLPGATSTWEDIVVPAAAGARSIMG